MNDTTFPYNMNPSFIFGENSELHIFHNGICLDNRHFTLTPEQMRMIANAIRCIAEAGEVALGSPDFSLSCDTFVRTSISRADDCPDNGSRVVDLVKGELAAIANALNFFAAKEQS